MSTDSSRSGVISSLTAELIGTFLIVLFGCGSVHAAVLTGAQSGVWQVAIVWGVAVMLAIYITAARSGAHLNPAITVASAVWGRFPWSKVPGYCGAQLVGAILAATILLQTYGSQLAAKERSLGVTRGEPGSVITAMCYGEYFPNPGGLLADGRLRTGAEWDAAWQQVSLGTAFFVEMLGTGVLALVIFAVTDPRNQAAPGANLAPVFIGLAVAALISIWGPLTQACFNPARDLGPRLVAYFGGWGAVALPGPNGLGMVAVYLMAPPIGAVLGAGTYLRLLGTTHGNHQVDVP